MFVSSPTGNFGNVLESTGQGQGQGQPSISVTVSPAPRRRGLDVPDTSDSFGGPSLSTSPSSPSSPLLPRASQDTASTSASNKSTTPPQKPLITEGNRFSHITAFNKRDEMTIAMKANLDFKSSNPVLELANWYQCVKFQST